MSLIDAEEFHSMRGHIADGNVVRFKNGDRLTLRNTMRGWVLGDYGPFDSAIGLSTFIYQHAQLHVAKGGSETFSSC